MKYSLAHTYADRVMDSPKFKFYRLEVESCYYVGGFGVGAKWVDCEEVRGKTGGGGGREKRIEYHTRAFPKF